MCRETVVHPRKIEEKKKELKQENIKVDREDSPEITANCLSKTFFHWAQPLFTKASKLHSENKALEQDDLLPIASIDNAEVLIPVFEEAWSNHHSIIKSIQAVIGKRIFRAGVLKVFNTCLQFTFPILLNEILRFMEETESLGLYSMKGYWLSALLFVAMALKAITENTYFLSLYRCGYQTRVAVSIAVYNKSLRLASSERNTKTLGELINLMQVDATKIEMFMPQFHVLWDGLLQITGYMAILYSLIGWPCFAGLVVMVLAGPTQGMIMKKIVWFES